MELQPAQTVQGQQIDNGFEQRPGMYFDLDDRPCTLGRWAELFEARLPVRQVALTRRAYVTVSTVWMGANHAWGDADALTYETMVFGGSLHQSVYRWPARRDVARVCHDAVVTSAFVWYRNPEYRILAWFVGTLAALLILVFGLGFG